MHDIACPSCSTKTTPKYSEPALHGTLLYYKCKNDDCRCHFCARDVPGFDPQVLHASTLKRKTGPRMGIDDVKCKNCGGVTKQVTSGYRPNKRAFLIKEEGAYKWRRHECPLHGATHSYEYIDGQFETTKRLRSKNPIADDF